jgi:predicted HTH domain antitoxin
MKRISSGQAAQLAGMDRTTFLMLLAESGLTMVNLRANSDIGGRL